MQSSKLVFSVKAFLSVAACSGGGGTAPPSSPPPPVTQNAAPTAEAGEDQTAVEDQTGVLDGQASFDADGPIAAFSWSQIAGPGVPLEAADSTTPRFVAPDVAAESRLEFQLTVTDADGATDTDQVVVIVSPDPVNDAPVFAFVFDGETRAYTLYIPETFAVGGPAYLVLHGGGQSMRRVLDPDTTTRRWVEIADRDGVALIVPNGFNNASGSGLGDNQSWNVIRSDNAGVTSSENDAGFILAVLDDAAARAPFDPDRVLVAGSSNGGIMTMTLLIQSPERFAAGAAFIAALPEEEIPDPVAPTPFFMLNGTEDPLILFEGGPVGANGSPTRSVPDTVDYWTRATGADPGSEFFVSLPNTNNADDCEITLSEYTISTGSDPVFVYYEAVGGGHNIPDPTPPLFSDAVLELIGN